MFLYSTFPITVPRQNAITPDKISLRNGPKKCRKIIKFSEINSIKIELRQINATYIINHRYNTFYVSLITSNRVVVENFQEQIFSTMTHIITNSGANNDLMCANMMYNITLEERYFFVFFNSACQKIFCFIS